MTGRGPFHSFISKYHLRVFGFQKFFLVYNLEHRRPKSDRQKGECTTEMRLNTKISVSPLSCVALIWVRRLIDFYLYEVTIYPFFVDRFTHFKLYVLRIILRIVFNFKKNAFASSKKIPKTFHIFDYLLLHSYGRMYILVYQLHFAYLYVFLQSNL